MLHGLSGTTPFGRSGTESSDYREPEWRSNPQERGRCESLNLANRESFGFLLTSDGLWKAGNTPPREPAETKLGDGPHLTQVTLEWREDRREDWIRFGKPVAERTIDRRQRIETYAAGQVFALVR